MGSRAQVHIKDTGVYLYTHWGADHIENDVTRAIGRGQRWGDPEYLTRIIFDEMKGSNIKSETGYGIGTSQHGDIEKLIGVSCKEQTIYVMEMYGNYEIRSYKFIDCLNGNSDDAPKPAGYTVADFLSDITQKHFGGQP
jgi:hypothetical protein